MDLYRMNDEHGLQSDDLCTEAFQLISDVLEPQLPGHSADPAATLLGDDLRDIPLPCRTEEISSDHDLLPAVSNKWDADIDLAGAEGSSLLLNSEKCSQATGLDCKECGKVFSHAYSLKKHYVSHSQERNHICKVCKKAFKRQDHLKGHMLTHMKVKPFICPQDGCYKSYCDFRSLSRHYEFRHGQWTKQPEVPAANTYLIPSKVLETAVPAPPVLPNNNIIRCVGTEILQQKVTPNMAVLQEPNANHVLQMVTINISQPNEAFIPVNTYSKMSMDPKFVRYSNPPPKTPLWNVPFPPSQKVQSMQNQPTIYSAESFHEATADEGCLEPLAGHLQSSDHRSDGHEMMRVQNSLTHEPDVTRHTIQPRQNLGFQVSANFFPPMISSQLHAATLSVSMPQCIPKPNGMRGWSDLQKDPQGLAILSKNTGATDSGTKGGQRGPTTVPPGQGSQKLTSNSKTRPKLGRSQGKSAISKDKPCLHLSSTVSASQVESFLVPDEFQGDERMYRLNLNNKGDVGERDMGSGQQKVAATAQPLRSAMCNTKDSTAGQLVIPVSVPFTNKDGQKDKDNRMSSYLQCDTARRRKKIRPYPRPLYIPPPVLEKMSTSSGCFQSCMRSPDTQLSEDDHNGTIHCQYTPKPMLSPIRQGTGLYFSTFHTPPNTEYQPPSLGEKDTARIESSVEPHINIGDEFQAVIPERRDRSALGRDEEKADLVWRPCLPTKTLTDVVNLACSSALPGGGCNLELALHCLHFSQGNILETLDKLLDKEHQKRLPPCLADYHYTGSDHWSASEKFQFKKAYYKQPKNFSYIQSKIPRKSISQCVEYYYTWKKMRNFQRRQTPVPEPALGTEQSLDGEEPQDKKEPPNGHEVKRKCQNIKTEPKERALCSQKETKDAEECSRKFACQECDRVFDKVKSRNAHMKKHRLQEERERALIYKSIKKESY